MDHTRASVLSVCTAAIIGACSSSTTALGPGNTVPTGPLDSLEKQAHFWMHVTGSDYEIGACGFSLTETDTANPNYVINAFDRRLEDSLPFRVGDFTLYDQTVIHTFEPVTYSYEGGGLLNVLICHTTLSLVEGTAHFDGVGSFPIRANLYRLTTENMSTGDETSDSEMAFVPQSVGKTRSLQIELQPYFEVDSTLPINEKPESHDDGQGPQPCNRYWTWCRDEHGFCTDIVQCWVDWESAVSDARLVKQVCYQAADLVYSGCMGDCLVDGQVVAGGYCAAKDIGCKVIVSIEKRICDTITFSLMTAADLNYLNCKKDAKNNNRVNSPGCDCPEGMVPFPSQGPVRWGDAPCQPYFDNRGIPGQWEELVFPLSY